MDNSAYAPRSLGAGERWGQEVQKNVQEFRKDLDLLREEVRRSASLRSSLVSQISSLTAQVGRLTGDIERLAGRLATVEDVAQQSALDIRAMRNELRSTDV